jgi:ABC-type spermidine/putrescine transport system permease subunit I
MIGSIIASLFGKANNQPLGSAVSILSMFVIAGVVMAFLISVRAIFGKHAIQRPEA